MGVIPKAKLPGNINAKSTITPSLYAGLAQEGREISSSIGGGCWWELVFVNWEVEWSGVREQGRTVSGGSG